jgi:hypothetical protein
MMPSQGSLKKEYGPSQKNPPEGSYVYWNSRLFVHAAFGPEFVAVHFRIEHKEGLVAQATASSHWRQ